MIQLKPNANLWNQVWFVPITKTLDPFPRQVCPVLLTSPAILTFLNFPSGFHFGRSGGQILQKISTGLVVGGGQDAIVNFPKKCIIGEPQLHLFSMQATYSLSFDLYTYIADTGNLAVWEYTGEIN
ncbi:hypothetical protein QUA26_08520 [Microcoleus sp. Pol12A4]|uniref:hypothetical protein n=1 Tax=Microcoleus sp. Pol8_C1 TaxID=2818896 RepID=UPI002FD54547